MNANAATASLEAARQALLRDLDPSAFLERYDCDRFTASVLGNRFRYVLANMSTKLRSNAFSPVIRDMDDFCITISGAPELGWPMPAASLTNPTHWGPVADAVRIVLEEVGLESLQPGDLVACNDSYRTGKHLNDASFIRPIFWEGKLVGAVHITAHQLDFGSRVSGGFDITSQSIWEDGLVMPPQVLYKAGVPQRAAFALIAANSRFPEMILVDLQVIRATLELGEQLLVESIERYGVDAYHGAVRYACDSAAEAMSLAVQALPDGEYFGREVIDGDGLEGSPEYEIRLRINKRGERLEFDFSGTSEASRTAVNCSWLDVKTGILLALKLLLDRKSSPNSGALRNVDIVLPPGCMLNPYPPTATMFYFSMVQAVIRATLSALNPVVGQDAIGMDTGSNSIHRAWGLTPAGQPLGRTDPDRGRRRGRRHGLGGDPCRRRRYSRLHAVDELPHHQHRNRRAQRAKHQHAQRDCARHRRPWLQSRRRGASARFLFPQRRQSPLLHFPGEASAAGRLWRQAGPADGRVGVRPRRHRSDAWRMASGGTDW